MLHDSPYKGIGGLYYPTIITMLYAAVGIVLDKIVDTVLPARVIDFHTMKSFKIFSNRVVSSFLTPMIGPSHALVVPLSHPLMWT